jgi:hypothetical protein
MNRLQVLADILRVCGLPGGRFISQITVWACLCHLLAPTPLSALEVSESIYEGRAQFVVKTASAEYWLDRNAGGFSRLIDRDGRDWISFRKEPLSKFPESAAAGYRGMPNAVFGKDNPDAGAGHPGFDKCESTLVASNVIRTVSKSGRWAWTWTFTETAARLKFEKNDPERAYWFLYEGPPAGRFSPTNQFWGTDLGGPNFDVPDSKAQRFGQWRWAYFGDRTVPRVLAVAQVEADNIEDTFWYMGSSDGAAATAPDGMVVFGFGRAAKSTPLFRERHEFVVSLIEGAVTSAAAHARVAGRIEALLNWKP